MPMRNRQIAERDALPGEYGGRCKTGGRPAVWFVKQINSDSDGAAAALLREGTLSLRHSFSGSGNVFKSDGTLTWANKNGNFIAWPGMFTGDFSAEATLTVTKPNNASSASGIGLGMFDSFDPEGAYAFMLMTSSLTANLQYAASAGVVIAGDTGVTYGLNVPMTLRFRREGSRIYWNCDAAQGPAYRQEQSAEVSCLWKGDGPMFAGIAFGNVDAEVTAFTLRDAAGATLYDLASGILEPVVPAGLLLEKEALEIPLGSAPVSVAVSALALGGERAEVILSGADSAVAAVAAVALSEGSRDRVLTVTPAAAGHFVLTAANGSDTSKTARLAVTVIDYPGGDDYGAIDPGRFTPVPGTDAAFYDGNLMLEFDAPPVLNPGGSVKIFAADGTLVDSILFAGETQRARGTEIKADSQLARAEGCTLTVIPHFGALAPERDYYVAVPAGAVTGTLNGRPFRGFSADPAAATWRFRTRPAPTLNPGKVTVDGDRNSAADFRSLQGALDSLDTLLPDAESVTIHLAPGTYRELVSYRGGKNLRIRGPEGNARGDTCEIRWSNANVLNGSASGRATFYVSGSSLVLENLSLVNEWVRVPGADNQAETLYFADGAGKTLAARNCSFRSNQDTLQTSGRAWFYDCFVEGNTDFIWGSSDAALFENCLLRCVNDGLGPDAPLMVSRTRPAGTASVGKGYVLKDSQVTVDAGMTAWYGRNAGGSGFYDQVTLINVAFRGEGSLGSTLWKPSAYYYPLGDASRVGWKAALCTGLGADTLPALSGASPAVADLASEYAGRDRILNRVIALSEGNPTGYADGADPWDLTDLERSFDLS